MFVVARGGGIDKKVKTPLIFHPHPHPPPSRGRESVGFRDEN